VQRQPQVGQQPRQNRDERERRWGRG
jgi:hypothetical protein